MIKTTLAPNAPWPYNGAEPYKPPKVPKVRSKPEDTDIKYQQWLEKQK